MNTFSSLDSLELQELGVQFYMYVLPIKASQELQEAIDYTIKHVQIIVSGRNYHIKKLETSPCNLHGYRSLAL